MLYTATEVAEQINATKPDFKHFKELFTLDDVNKFKEDFENTTCIFQKILKAQIICCYRQTHSRFWIDIEKYKEFLFYKAKDMGLLKRIRSYDKVEYIDLDHTYFINSSFDSSTQVAGNLVYIQNYIPKYLWNKVRTKTQVEYKQLKPDAFSLTTFKNYLEGLKKEIPSSQAVMYLAQITNYPLDINQQYIEVLVNHLSQPSWEFQEYLSGYSINLSNCVHIDGLTKVKYIGLSRYYIKNLVESNYMLVPQSVMDSQDSAYKPFVTGVKRKPTTDLNQFTALVGTLIVLKAAVKQTTELVEVYTYFTEELEKHLKDHAYDEVKAKYFETLKNTRNSIDEVLNGSI